MDILIEVRSTDRIFKARGLTFDLKEVPGHIATESGPQISTYCFRGHIWSALYEDNRDGGCRMSHTRWRGLGAYNRYYHKLR